MAAFRMTKTDVDELRQLMREADAAIKANSQ
jgi:hypothetical protein